MKKIRWLVGSLTLLIATQVSATISWQDLWLNSNQQGMHSLLQGDPRLASKLFKTPDWRGVAYYRSHDYEQALHQFSDREDAESYYNRGNALAHLNRYDEAISAYDKALQLNPNFADAKFNRDLLKKVKQQQQQQQQANSNNKQDDKQQQQSKNHDGQGKHPGHAKHDQQQNASNKPNANDAEQKGEHSTHEQPAQSTSVKNDATEQKPEDKANQAGQLAHNQQAANDKTNKASQKTQSSAEITNEREQQQAMRQALQRVPDEPGSLLQQIFKRDYQRRHNIGLQEESP